jgi:PleD family two-component response regulator
MEQVGGPLERVHGCELDFEGKHIAVKLSAGVTQHQRGESVAQLLERADATMYEQKRQAAR